MGTCAGALVAAEAKLYVTKGDDCDEMSNMQLFIIRGHSALAMV